MARRAIRLAALSAVFALVAWAGVFAQNLDAGKSPAQLFSGSCAACHSTPRGLLKSVAPGQLPGFLRQHYTTGSDAASTLAGYLIQNGAGQKADAPAARTAPKGVRPAPDSPSATADAPTKGKGRQTTTIPTVEGTPADGQPPAAKRQATGKKKGDDKRAPAVATPEPAPAAAPAATATPDTKPDAKPEAKPEAVAAPEVKPEAVPEKKPEAPPAPLPVEAETTPSAPPAAATPAEASKPAAEPGPVIIVVPRESASPAASEGQSTSSAPATPAPPAADTPAPVAAPASPPAAPAPAAPSSDAPK